MFGPGIRRTHPAIGLLAGLAILLAPPRAARADGGPLLKTGDRVVVYGDSITEQRLYSRYLQQYVYCRYPDADIRFFNAGWGGDTAAGGLVRLDRDVLSLKPTVVTLFFGMNDGGYKAKDDATIAAYRKSMSDIVQRLKGAGARVVVFTPGCVDYDRKSSLKDCDYNAVLEALGRQALEVARENGFESVDVFHPMLEFQAARKHEDAAWSMIPDAVHPSPEGHLVMTRFMLQGLGVEPMPDLGSVDLATDKGEGLKVVKKAKEEVTLTTTAPTLTPFWFDPVAGRGMTASGFLDRLAGQRLTVAGLAPGEWTVTIDGKDAGIYPSLDLAHGVVVAGSYSERGKSVHDLVALKENIYYGAWRDVRVGLEKSPGVDRVVAGLMGAVEGYHGMIREQAKPQAEITISLTPAPEGTNFALHKTYVSSDTNRFGWGPGTLTDGSWEADKEHCFATGDWDTFPKTVTIDLQQPLKIGVVRFGVPDFGSTRTIDVAVSLDGAKWKPVGGHEFGLRHKERFTLSFGGVTARYVRLTYKNHHSEQVGGFTSTFCFTTEVEVYGPK